jgi:hypothetical protein
MGTRAIRASSAALAETLLPVLLAALALVACGGSSPSASDTAVPSPAVAVTVSSAPTPTPTHTWTPGAKPVPAATFPTQEGTTAVGEASTGWVFTPTVDIQVTHLGYFDDSGDGLRHDHPAGIFDMATKKLLVRSIVRRQSPLEASYRFVKIAPVALKAGREYAVVAYAMPPFDPEVNWPKGLVWAPEIEVGDNVYTETSKLAYPTAHTSDLYLTPNFKFRPTFASVAAATIPAQEPMEPPYNTCTNGWEFKPTVDIKVTDLGFYDDGGNGLRHPHPLGIFDTATEKLLVKTTVQRKSPLDGVYRFAKIQPLTLKAGKSYVVATVSYPPFDPEVSDPSGLAFAPEIEYVGYRETLTDEFVFPAPSTYKFYSANFKYRPL